MENRENKVILIVDDTESNIDILVELLGDRVDLRVALDAETALQIVSDERPDLALLDVYMPDMDGLTLAEELNRRLSPPVPIVFVTSETGEKLQKRAAELGALAVIGRPVDASRLFPIIDSL